MGALIVFVETNFTCWSSGVTQGCQNGVCVLSLCLVKNAWSVRC